ncbi:hypothetical protein SK128_005887 [Halocaridina rubra]|uniref:Uncharacterized protein n=1 Tax=Halocaridina rubra TaxID=373956 RepID=A0AAN9AFN9_HALRR
MYSPPTDGWNGSWRTHRAVASRHRPQAPTVVPSQSNNLPTPINSLNSLAWTRRYPSTSRMRGQHEKN